MITVIPYRGWTIKRNRIMNKLIISNWIKNLLAPAMKANGCPVEIRTSEDVIENLYYLSKQDSRGSRYIPLQYKRMIEKIVCGLFNSFFEYDDRTDVYFEKIGNVLVCTANVRLVVYGEDGSRKVVGHGFHSLSFDEVMPGIFMSEAERVSKWKSTVIGGAKSRALYDAGIGLEFYGDIFIPEEDAEGMNMDEPVKENIPEKKKKDDPVYTESGLPIPQPKKRKTKKVVEEEPLEDIKEKEPEDHKDEKKPIEAKEMSIDDARASVADCGNYSGMTLGEIYETAPKNLVFLMRNAKSDNIKKAATVIIKADKELSERFLSV